MFQTTVYADENTDPEIAVDQLRAHCKSAGLAAHVVEELTAQLSDILTPLVVSGKKLAARGSQLSVARDIGDDRHRVKLIFGSASQKSGWRKLLSRLLGR